jgi:two-component system response regulator YesN
MNILIVDDEPNIRRSIGNLLVRNRYGFEHIDLAENGQVALDYLSRKKYDILVSDVIMPGCDGLELVARLREIDRACYVLMISGYDDVGYIKKALKHEVVDYILKPIDIDEFDQALKRIIVKIRGADAGTGQPAAPSLTAREAVDAMRKRIENEYAHPINLRTMAFEMGFSPNYLGTLFHSVTGYTVSAYLSRRRMIVAEGLLEKTDLPIQEISRLVGIEDSNYFAKMFKKKHGETPIVFRENYHP